MRDLFRDDGGDPAGIVRGAGIPATNSLFGALVLTHMFTGLYGWWVLGAAGWSACCGTRSTPFRIEVGSQFRPLVAHGDWWRLLSGMFLHVDALHLAFNVIAARSLGQVLEPWVGGRRLLLWFIGCGLVAALATHIAGVRQSDGASGAVFGWLGALLVLAWRRRGRMNTEDRWLLGPVLWSLAMMNLAMSIALPFVNLVAHVGGLVTGALLALAFRGRR